MYARRRECDIAVALSGRYRPSEWSATAVGAQRGYGWHHQARQIAKKAELAHIERRLEAAQERRDDATTPFTGRKKPARAADPAGPVARWPAPGTDISDRRRHREEAPAAARTVGRPAIEQCANPWHFGLAEWFSMLVSSYRLSPIRSAAINATNAGLLRR